MKTVERLRHGGIMANYQCTAACRHCLYACSPERTGGYISLEMMKEVCGLLREGGCRSVHIGGGEPFLDFDGLLTLVEAVTSADISVEYIETNAYWATDRQLIEQRLHELNRVGADTLCVSLDPFHAEYVPYGRPLYLAEACRQTGFGYFLWQEKFLPELSALDSGKAYSRPELERLLSHSYVLDTARSYGLSLGGRAINIEAEYSKLMPTERAADSRPCKRLLSSNHFHVDMAGRFIPPGCTGIAIPLAEAISGIPDGKYPALDALLSGGSARLLQYARQLGFAESQQGYPSGCALCFHIRHWLVENTDCPELDAEHYEQSLKFYTTPPPVEG